MYNFEIYVLSVNVLYRSLNLNLGPSLNVYKQLVCYLVIMILKMIQVNDLRCRVKPYFLRAAFSTRAKKCPGPYFLN